ncbi:MAG: phospholipid carrier-dependent glycosyltransferase [Chloroflexi bacterium]|nr:MAG: phospholipid carrier-dependent glycosyltransferase [Chloroflexota bacterium]
MQINRKQALVLMVLCLLVGAALRLPALTAVPPGLHYDEAANGVLAGDIGLRGERPVFIPSYTGKEVLFFYLAGGLMRLVGESVFTLRLTAAFVGLLTIAATYWLGREMLADRRLALLAAVLLAVSFWHVLFSRLGFRAITQPMLQAMTVAALWRGLRRDSWRWLLVSGVCLGLTAYTYLAARLFPVLLAAALWPLLWARAGRGQRARQLGVWLVGAVVVIAPLVAYFVANPSAFWVRISQVAPGEVAPLSLEQSFLRALGMFFLRGDPYVRFNVPERPLFDWFWGSLLLVGWGISWWRYRRLSVDWQKAAVLLLTLSPLVMILPTALANREIVPSNLRAIGLIPFVFYLPAIGLVAVLQDLYIRFGQPRVQTAVMVVASLMLVSGGFRTGQLYFQVWGRDAELFYESDGDLAAVATYLNDLAEDSDTLFVSALHYQHPTVAFLSQRYDAVKWLVNSEAIVFPPAGTAVYVFPRRTHLPEWARPYFQNIRPFIGPAAPDGNPAFAVYSLNSPPAFSISHPVNANFGHVITLLGYELLQPGLSGNTLPLLLYWRVENKPPTDLQPFVHLEDNWRYRWGQIEPLAYPSAQWEPGEVIVQRVDVPVRAGTPPGEYRLRVGLFQPETGERVAHLDENGRFAGDSLILENIPIQAAHPPEELPQPPNLLDVAINSELKLIGYERGTEQVATGESLWLGLWWLATKPLPPMTTRLELMRPDNTGFILTNTQPVHDTYPFVKWQTPQFLIDHLSPRIPASFPAGEYTLVLHLLDGNDETLLVRELGRVIVEETERVFTPPDTQFPMDATFGNEIRLLGYDLVSESDTTYRLNLVWQALTTPVADYTVFVHLLRLDGTCCVWQQDVQPRQNQYPTTRWVPDEVVTDTYEIVLPPDLAAGNYTIEVGLYLPDTGQRLQVVVPGLRESDVVYLRPLIIP